MVISKASQFYHELTSLPVLSSPYILDFEFSIDEDPAPKLEAAGITPLPNSGRAACRIRRGVWRTIRRPGCKARGFGVTSLQAWRIKFNCAR